jgi:hypothetical protein
MAKPKDLVEIIRDNPECIAIIDNDSWELLKEDPNTIPFIPSNYETWSEANTLATDEDDLIIRGDGGYGSGNCYGGDILQALAAIVGVKVRSV